MTNIELAKKALSQITGESFRLGAGASTGGKCDDGWCDSLDLYLSKEQILYLIKEKNGHEDLFEGIVTEEIDVESTAYKMTYEAAWPDGGPSAHVNNPIPDELSELAEALESLDTSNPKAVADIRKELKLVKGGDYTFNFTIEASGYYFTEDAEETITLTDKEALGLLYGQYEFDEVFEGICKKVYYEELIDDKAKEMGFAENYDNFGYSSECEELDAYIDAWDYILDSILAGDITEDSLVQWLQYFEDSSNYEMTIEEWYDHR